MLDALMIVILLADTTTMTNGAGTTPAPRRTLDSTRVVKEFPAIQVRSQLHDMRSSQTVRVLEGAALRSFPVDGLLEALSAQPGVVAYGEELHVRGGRSGETVVSLGALRLNEPFRRRPLEVPLFAIRSADLVSGAPEAQYGGGLAGVIDLHTVDPGERPAMEWHWQTDGGIDTHYDRLGARLDAPLRASGLGIVAAADMKFDDTAYPSLRTEQRRRVLGTSWGWRAENRMLGFLKLAPVRAPERFNVQLFANRLVHRPFNPSWTLDGWVDVPANLKLSPVFSPDSLPGYQRYRAADHVAITDDRQLAGLVEFARVRPTRRSSVSLGWIHTQTVRSISGRREPITASHRPRYGSALDRDLFDVMWGDDPIYRENESDVLTLAAESSFRGRTGSITAGVGLAHEHVSMREMEWMPYASRAFDTDATFPLDSVRSFNVSAPGGHAFVQGRWNSGGLVLHTGIRAEYFTPGAAATNQTLPGANRGVWSLAPRLGITYPISVQDAFSLAYVRVQQSPGRDFLYDARTAISDRQPLGNPALEPATLISYEAAVKHLFDPEWAMQAAVFYRDVFNQMGAVDARVPGGAINLRYSDLDESHAHGFEISVTRASGTDNRLEAHYVWMNAWGNESRPEGDPYGPVRFAGAMSIGDHPVSWDRRHTFLLNGSHRFRAGTRVSWSSALASPLPWTPKPRRQPFTDFGLVNSRRLDWSENTNVNLEWNPRHARGLTFGIEARNLFDNRAALFATVDGYPNPVINTRYDDYGAYRTEGGGGAAYWSAVNGKWIPVDDPRLRNPPRALRASVGARW